MIKYIFAAIFFIIEHAVLILSIITSALTILVLMFIKLFVDIKKLEKEVDDDESE